jgi:hypothetical protein
MADLNNKPLRFLLQAINYCLFMGLIWYFSALPIRIMAEEEAMITIAFAHAGELREPCRKLSSEELAQLPANMRKLEDCPRERSAVLIEALLDGETLYKELLQPSGLFRDGGVDIYYNGRILSGEHRFEIKMNDNSRGEGFNHVFSQDINIRPAQIMLVDFDSLTGFGVN